MGYSFVQLNLSGGQQPDTDADLTWYFAMTSFSGMA
jgi:hypothetical protein